VVPDPDDLGVLPMLAILTVVSMVGFESAAFVGAEARRPLVGVTRAVMGTPLVVGAFFLLAAVASLTGHGAVLAAAYHDGAAAAVPWAVVVAVQAGTACSWLACALGCVQASARLLWSLGTDRALPRRFATARAGVPVTGLVTVLGAGLVGAMWHDVVVGTSSVALTTVIEIGFAVAYTLVAAAGGRFLRRIGEHTAATRAAAVAVTAGGATLLVGTCADALADGNLVVPGVLVAVLACGPVWAARVRRHDASALRGLGAFDTVETADLLPGAGEVALDGDGRRTVVRHRGGTGEASWVA
jgi:amino acid transporter